VTVFQLVRCEHGQELLTPTHDDDDDDDEGDNKDKQ
jgi:hypothetical protein